MQAVNAGLLKILSKMGISLLSRFHLFSMDLSSNIFYISLMLMYISTTTDLAFSLFSYCGAQIFEIYGLGKEVVDLAFTGSVSKISGLTFDEVRNTSH